MKNTPAPMSCYWSECVVFRWRHQPEHQNAGNNSKDQIVEALLARHRQDSRGYVGAVDNTQENFWPSWYRQHVEVLWTTLNQFNNTGLTMQDKRICFALANVSGII